MAKQTPKRHASTETAIVKKYLRLISGQNGEQRQRSRWRNPEGTLDSITETLKDENLDPFRRLMLVQESMDISKFLYGRVPVSPLADAEAAFIEVAAAFSERKGITYAAWRECGVAPAVLKKAGIPREVL